jgi:hypothetical protein
MNKMKHKYETSTLNLRKNMQIGAGKVKMAISNQ